MKKPKKAQWNIGYVFGVQLVDGSTVVGQVIGREARVLNSVSCAFFDLRLHDPISLGSLLELPSEKVFSTVFATRDLLDSGTWKPIGNLEVKVPTAMMPNEPLRASGFVGAAVYGSRILTEFLNAFFALVPWDDWKDPNYLDGLLVSPEKNPKRLLFKAR